MRLSLMEEVRHDEQRIATARVSHALASVGALPGERGGVSAAVGGGEYHGGGGLFPGACQAAVEMSQKHGNAVPVLADGHDLGVSDMAFGKFPGAAHKQIPRRHSHRFVC